MSLGSDISWWDGADALAPTDTYMTTTKMISPSSTRPTHRLQLFLRFPRLEMHINGKPSLAVCWNIVTTCVCRSIGSLARERAST